MDQASPAAWPIRALFNSRAGIFEFDRQGNLLAQNGKTNVRAVKVRYGEMDPSIKAARQHVYWLIGSRTMSEVNEASAIDSGIVLAGQRACPAQRVAEAFRILHGHAYGYLNGNCAKAVKRTLGAGEFWVYPEDRNVDHPQYWVVQYFHQPEALSWMPRAIVGSIATRLHDPNLDCWNECLTVKEGTSLDATGLARGDCWSGS